MDQYKFADPEELIPCPYQNVHMVTRKRMAIHLDKCRKQHTELAKVMGTCPFNYSHRVPQPEMEVKCSILKTTVAVFFPGTKATFVYFIEEWTK